MGALLDQFRSVGIAFRPMPGGKLHATGSLTDDTRAAIREYKAAILAELAAANDAATLEQTRELRELVGIVAEDWPPDEQIEALAVALADPGAALTCFRALAAERAAITWPVRAREPDDGMRPCTACLNLSPGGRCLAAWRGESFGSGMSPPRDWAPAITDRPQRCLPYRPLPSDPDKRTGAERWPFLTAPHWTNDESLAKGFR